MSQDHVLASTADHICTITLNRPDKKNALTLAMYRQLNESLREAQSAGDVRAVIIGGSKGCFTSGNDLKDFMNAPPGGNDSPALDFLRTISTFPKPIVAAVAGPAIGIGTTLLLHCDLIVAGAGARFQLPFVNLGLCPEAACSYLLPRLAGPHRAAEMLLLGDPIDAQRAAEFGIVNRVVDDADVDATARKLAGRLAAQPPAALELTKQLIRQPSAGAVEATMDAEMQHFIARLQSAEAREAFQAFFERRPPNFENTQR